MGINTTERLTDDVTYNTNTYYIGFGKASPWGNPDVPVVPTDSNVTYNSARNGMCYFKRVLSNNLVSGASRIDWMSGNIYDMYDDNIVNYPAVSGATSLRNAIFYVLTTDFNVYKCIYNAGGSPSTVMPTGTSVSFIYSTDGYVWQYMYTLAPYLQNAFLDSVNMPVTNSLYAQYYSGGSISNTTINLAGSGYSASPTLVVNGDGYSKLNPFSLQSILIANPGFGYTTAPTLSIAPPNQLYGSPITATATCTINASGQVSTVTFGATGYGYNTAPNVTVSAPVNGYIQWQPNTYYVAGQILQSGMYYYTVSVGGTSSGINPSGAIGQTNGSTTLTYVGTQASIFITGATNPAVLKANVQNGQITSVTVVDPGIGYTNASITVSDSTGTGAILTPDLSIGDLNTNQATVELSAVKGALSYILITSQGTGYSYANVQIVGDGTGATATANVSNGNVTSITITSFGTGYTTATAIITGTGTGATARVILAPWNGHGYSAVDELYATSMITQISLSQTSARGLFPSNSYRQIGVFKNLKEYSSSQSYVEYNAVGSTLVNGFVDITKFIVNDTVTQVRTGLQFTILGCNSSSMLLSPVTYGNILDGDSFTSSSGTVMTSTSITYPDVDLFSGDLLQLINCAPFNTSATQTIAFNDVITF